MKKYQNIIYFVILLLVDIAWQTMYSSEMFNKHGKLLPLYITTRIGLLAIGIFMTRRTKNWTYGALMFAYLLFSFAVTSLYYISTNSGAAV